MAAARPFASRDELSAKADAIWAGLTRVDWLEAFAAHPRIGQSAEPGSWSASEQAGVTDASQSLFVDRNRDYEARFGHIFIVCASGKSAAEMLDILERRMNNTPDDELREASEQQRQITRLRLDKLLS
jgi:OHCU decarboxylase